MPISKPTKTTIRTDDFRDHTFSFPVESVLGPQQGSGKLVISAPLGYLLTTSLDHEPTRVQTLDHILQPDGNLVARGTITLLANDEPLGNSTITIRNPSGETVLLTVDATPETALINQRPTLYVSTQELVFPKTSPDKPAFVVFTIAQQNSDAPVTITTDAPEHFQLASDRRPAFGPSLTLEPSPTGTYVHVRYIAQKSGLTVGQLIIKTPYTSRFINLTGHSTGWLPIVRNAPRIHQQQAAPQIGPAPSVKWGLPTAVLVGSLSIAGFYFRCQLVPGLCEEIATSGVTTGQPSSAASTPPAAVAPTGRAEAIHTDESTPILHSAPDAASAAYIDPAEKRSAIRPQASKKRATTPTVANRPKASATQPTDSPANKLDKLPQPIPSPTEESELERELNRKPKKSTVN